MREASLQSLKESLKNCEDGSDDANGESLVVKNQHFVDALKNIKPSVTDEVG